MSNGNAILPFLSSDAAAITNAALAPPVSAPPSPLVPVVPSQPYSPGPGLPVVQPGPGPSTAAPAVTMPAGQPPLPPPAPLPAGAGPGGAVIPSVLPFGRFRLTNPSFNPSTGAVTPTTYAQASTDPLTGQPSAASPNLTKLGKLLTILRGAGIGAAVGSTQPTFGTGLLAANQFQNQEAQQYQAQQAGGMNLAMQRAQLAMLPEQQEFMRQQMTIAPRTDPETGQYIGNLSEKGYESYLASRNKGVGAAMVAAASREKVSQGANQAKIQAVLAGKRFQSVPNVGLFDTQNPDGDGNPTLVPGSEQGVTITPELAQEYNMPGNFVGRHMSLANLQGAQRMLMAGAQSVTYSTDPLGLVTVSQRQKQMPAGVPGGPPATTGGPVTGGVPVVPRRRAAAPPTAGGGTVPTTGGATAPAGGGTATAPTNIQGPAALQDAARGLVEHDTPPTDVPRRGATWTVMKAAADRYSMEHYGVPFDMAQADTDYKFSQNQNNQYMLKNMDSITEPGGALDILEKAVAGLPQMDSQTLNKVFNLTKTEFGDPAVTRFQTALLTFADKFSKVMGGGAVTDTGRQQGLDLVGAQFSKNQTAAAIDTLKQDLQAQKRGMIANNPYLKKQFGTEAPPPQTAPQTKGSVKVSTF